jgi:hypothetical protein
MTGRNMLDFLCFSPLIALGFLLGYGVSWPSWAALVFCLSWLVAIGFVFRLLATLQRSESAARLSLFFGGAAALGVFLWVFGSWRAAA